MTRATKFDVLLSLLALICAAIAIGARRFA